MTKEMCLCTYVSLLPLIKIYMCMYIIMYYILFYQQELKTISNSL